MPRERAAEVAQVPGRLWEWFAGEVIPLFTGDQPGRAARVETVLAYSAEDLYVCVRTDQAELVNRDRAYQNGDGLHFVLAAPLENAEPTREFQVVAVSPLGQGNWSRFTWYRNVDLAFTPLPNTEVTTAVAGGWQYILTRLAWNDITPLQPFIHEFYGFNISYVQAVPEGANVFMLVRDELIQSEQSPRAYTAVLLEEPQPPAALEWGWMLSSQHRAFGENISVCLGINSPAPVSGQITVSVTAVDGTDRSETVPIVLRAGLNRLAMTLPLTGSGPGEHTVITRGRIGHDELSAQANMWVYDCNRVVCLERDIADMVNQNMPGRLGESAVTLMYRYQSLLAKISALKPYESFEHCAERLDSIHEDCARVRSGRNLFVPGEELRLAFRSQQDGTLQPYSLYIPEGRGEGSPLLVYLHGSGEDDRSLFSQPLMIKLAKELGIVLLAPYARGTSHFYIPPESVEDIAEITEKVVGLLGLDAGRVLLCGFSMGGYGVLRTRDHRPDLFGGLAMFSGHHNLPCRYGWEGAVDYGADELLRMLNRVPFIIFHGTEDRNCAYTEVASFWEGLKRVNSNVEVHVKEGRGHAGLTDDWYPPFADWVKRRIK